MSTKNSQDCQFLDLNDDCIYQIYKYLPIIDWCSLRETCTRLQMISDDCFKRQFTKFKLSGNYIRPSNYNELFIDDFRSVIRNFGPFFSKLTINCKSFATNEDLSQVVPLLDKYCTSLQNLKIVRIEVDTATIIQCKRLFSNLKRLVIDKCCDSDEMLATYLNHSPSLKELELIRMSNILGLTADHHNSLESLSIKSSTNFEFSFFEGFLGHNPQLKTLKIISCDTGNINTDQILQLISDNLSNLDELSMRLMDSGDLSGLRIAGLKKLEIDTKFIGINPFLNELATHKRIETLHLSTFEITDESVKTLCNLKTLKVLKFTTTRDLREKVCQKLALELPDLLEIHIIECFETKFIDINAFAEFSITLKKIVFIRYIDDSPSLTKDVFLSLIAARQRNSHKETLNVLLDYDDYLEVRDQLMWEENLHLLTEKADVINVLTLEEEKDKLAVYEFGSGNRKGYRGVFEDIERDFSDVDDDSYDYDDYEYDDNDDYDEVDYF